jgi:hypothetical protein
MRESKCARLVLRAEIRTCAKKMRVPPEPVRPRLGQHPAQALKRPCETLVASAREA